MSRLRFARPRSLASLVLGLVLGATMMLVGLAQAGRLAGDEPQTVVALAQLVDAEHRRVDLLLEKGDVEGAIAALEELRAGPWPSHEDAGDVAVKLRHDVYGRLLRLRIDNPDIDPQKPEALLAIVDEGLGEDAAEVDTNPFTARLTALHGEVFEGLGRDDDALDAYESALDMNRTLLERELGGTTP